MGSASSKFKKYIQHGDEFAAMQIYQSSPELRKNLDPNISYGEHHQHNTALHYAAKHGMKHLLRTFLNDHGGNPNKKNGCNETVLHAACHFGSHKTFSSHERRAACVTLLLQWRGVQLNTGERERIDLNAQDSNGNSALHTAAAAGLQRCVELLLAAGSPLFLENNDKMTPCDLAMRAEHHNIARLLESKMVFADSSDTVNEIELYGGGGEEVYSGLRTQDLQEAKDQLLVETSDMLNIPLFTAEALLRDNEWSREALLEKWIKDPVKCCQLAGVQPPTSAYQQNHDMLVELAPPTRLNMQNSNNKDELHREDQNSDEILCDICLMNVSSWDFPVAMSCSHQFCSACWEHYLTVKIQEGDAHHILCPAHHCHILVPPELIEKLVSPEVARRYLQFDIKAFVESNRSIKWCPMAGCGRAVRLPETEQTRPSDVHTSHAVDCGKGHFFCWECLGEAHAPSGCDQWQQWLAKIAEIKPEELQISSSESEDAANCLWLVTNSKPCPNCKSPIQKNEGCNHMKCSKCKFDFCWVCLESWKRHSSATGGYFRCNRFQAVHKADEKQGILISEALLRNQQTTELNRFLHYYTRFKNHENSRRLEEPLLNGVHQKMKILASSLKKGEVDNGCTKFIEEGVRELLKARRILCGSYVYGYYLEDNGYSRTIFEFMQNELEEITEKLSEMVARPYLRTPRSVIVQTTILARRKRHEFARAVSKGLVPPETPPALRRIRKRNYRVLAINHNDETMSHAIAASLKDFNQDNGWVKDDQGRHNNISAIYDFPDFDSDEEESEVNQALAVSLMGDCARDDYSRLQANNPHSNHNHAIHEYCNSQHCSSLDPVQVNVTADYNMDLVIALEMSRLQMIEDEMKKRQREESSKSSIVEQSPGSSLITMSDHNGDNDCKLPGQQDDQLKLAIQMSLQDDHASSIATRPQQPLPTDCESDVLPQSQSLVTIDSDDVSCNNQGDDEDEESNSVIKYHKTSADLTVDYFLKSLAGHNIDLDAVSGTDTSNLENQKNPSPQTFLSPGHQHHHHHHHHHNHQHRHLWDNYKGNCSEKETLSAWKAPCVAEDGRFEIGDIHETGLYNDSDEFNSDADIRLLKRSHSTGDLVMRKGRISTRSEEPRYHLDSDHSSQHDDRPEDLARRILAIPASASSTSNRHSLMLQHSGGSTAYYGGQSSLEDTTTSDSLNADLEVCGILGNTTEEEMLSSGEGSGTGKLRDIIHLATLPRVHHGLINIGKKSALDLGDGDNDIIGLTITRTHQSLSDEMLSTSRHEKTLMSMSSSGSSDQICSIDIHPQTKLDGRNRDFDKDKLSTNNRFMNTRRESSKIITEVKLKDTLTGINKLTSLPKKINNLDNKPISAENTSSLLELHRKAFHASGGKTSSSNLRIRICNKSPLSNETNKIQLETDSSNEYESETGIPKSPTLFISGVSISRTPEPKSPSNTGRQSRSSSLTASLQPPPSPLLPSPLSSSVAHLQGLSNSLSALGLSLVRRRSQEPASCTAADDSTDSSSPLPAHSDNPKSKSASEPEREREMFRFPKSSTDGALSSVLHVQESNLSSDDFHEALFLLERSPKGNQGSKRRKKSKKERHKDKENSSSASKVVPEASSAL
ncbi:uncharacterized protein LOC142317242 [Lycorma delicatula]|uniref:uncharacterized protein LOC142317242 n=1 Tax=Lycorma delicatula TaxID=130591 RepID=UPI003F516B15